MGSTDRSTRKEALFTIGNILTTLEPINAMDLIRNNEKIIEYQQKGRSWVQNHHNLYQTADILYGYYKDLGWV